MAKKPAPKYPRRGRVLRKRLLSQALLILAAAGVIAFYFYIKSTQTDDAGTLYRLGESIGSARQESSRPAGAPAPPPAPVNPPARQIPPSRNTAALPEPRLSPPLPPPGAAAASPDSLEAAPSAPAETPPETKAPDAAAALPFADQSLEEVGRELGARYAGTPAGQWGERVPGVVTRLGLIPAGEADSKPPLVLALTFDACGGAKDGYDEGLIAFLREQRIPATLFVTSLWMRAHPETFRELAADPLFEIAAHGERHRPCSVNGKSVYGIKGTASMAELVREVLANARDISLASGRAPRWFRSGTAFYDEQAVRVIHDLGMGVAGYSVAGDQGATLPAAQVAARALKAKNGDILLFHMNKPRSGTREGLKRALPQLMDKGAVFVRLSDSPDREQ